MRSPTLPPAPASSAAGIESVRRAKALQATMAEFAAKPFDFGRVDCMRLFTAHAKRMGHRKLPAVPRYRTLDQAKAVLAARGATNLEQLLDGLAGLTRIAPAAAWQGDIVMFAGGIEGDTDDGLGALGISAGGNKVVGWHADSDLLVVAEMNPGAVKAAWRL